MDIDWVIYRDGRRSESPTELPGVLNAARKAGGFVWVELRDPTSHELDLVTREFALHQLAVDDVSRTHQQPKLETFEDSLFLVVKPVVYEPESDSVSSDDIMLFLGEDYVLTIGHGEGSPVGDVRTRLERDPEILGKGPTAVMYAIVDTLVNDYLEVATELLVDLEELEAQVFSSPGGGSRGIASRIYTFKRQILEFQRATSPLAQPLDELSGTGRIGLTDPLVPDAARPFFRNTSSHLTRVNASVDSLERLVSDILSAHLAEMSVRQNDDMRKISAWAAMAAVPTMVAGIYGMNFVHMPELNWTASYPVVIAVMVGLAALLYRLFKRQGWM